MEGQIFFGYPERPPAAAEVMRNAAKGLRDSTGATTRTWEQLKVDGRVVISQVLGAIDTADMSVFDVTHQNPNVLFEAGYAIGRGKPVWLILDSTRSNAKQSWRELAIANDIGYTAFKNSRDLVMQFTRLDPLNELEPLYDTLIEPSWPDGPVSRDSLLYCKTFEPFEAANRLDNLLEGRAHLGPKVSIADPAETSLSPLSWFIRELASAAGVVVHFASEDRNRSLIHNNRHAFVAGLASGLEIPTLLLAEQGYVAPFDYENVLRTYETAEECVAITRGWLNTVEFEKRSYPSVRGSRSNKLSKVRLGEHVAENEREELPDYFLETSAFNEVIAARDSIFVGHRGTGKTANALQAYESLVANKTNLAVLIKPAGFEFPAIMAVVDQLSQHQHDYFFDSLWRFVIQTEIAATLLNRIDARNRAVPQGADEQAFVEYVDGLPFDMRSDVSERLQGALTDLSRQLSAGTGAADSRNLINEAFHSKSLAVLRKQLGSMLRQKKRVAVFVDNLDKGWQRGADFTVMARFILGLLTARGHIVVDFRKQDYWRDSIKLTVAVFLRSDIYSYLKAEAREPDKLPISTVVWRDWGSLKNLLESRFMYSDLGPDDPTAIWTEVFTAEVDREPLQEYLARVTLPRPRDIVFFCNAAIGRAIDRGHSTVESDDFIAAHKTYSQYAYEALLVENGVTIPQMEQSVLAFISAPAIASAAERRAALTGGGVAPELVARVMKKLLATSFFGIEVAPGVFEYPEIGSEAAVAEIKAARHQSDPSLQRLEIHAAFRSFLDVDDRVDVQGRPAALGTTAP